MPTPLPDRSQRPSNPAVLPALTIGDHLDALARRTALAASHDVSAHMLASAELALDVERVACALLGLGVERGDHVGVWAADSPRWARWQLATARVGGVLVALDDDRPNEAVEEVLRRTFPRLLAVADPDRIALLAAMRARLPVPPRLVALDEQAVPGPGDLGWGELMVLGAGVDSRLLAERGALLDPDDCVTIEYGSGDVDGRRLTHRDHLRANL